MWATHSYEAIIQSGERAKGCANEGSRGSNGARDYEVLMFLAPGDVSLRKGAGECHNDATILVKSFHSGFIC
jgi:hypothetical protein